MNIILFYARDVFIRDRSRELIFMFLLHFFLIYLFYLSNTQYLCTISNIY